MRLAQLLGPRRRTLPVTGAARAHTFLFALLFLLAPAGLPAHAQEDPRLAERLAQEGDAFLKVGNYFQASERYKSAVRADPWNGGHRLRLGHAFFALGNYGYAAFELRRGIRYLGYPEDYAPALAGLFPSDRAVARHIQDCRDYLVHYPKDDRAWIALAYFSLYGGKEEDAARASREVLSRADRDAVASYFLRRLEARLAARREKGEAAKEPAAPTPPPVEVVREPALPRDPVMPPARSGLDAASLPEGRRFDPLATLSSGETEAALSPAMEGGR